MPDASLDELHPHLLDKPFVAEAIFFVVGAALMCTLAIFQKSAMNEDVTALRGYILPFFFGGGAAALVAYLNRRSRRHLIMRLRAQAERDILLSANRAKSECIANMSHELRTPLNAILGFSSSIQSEVFGPLKHDKYGEYISHISHSGQHLLSLINDILDVSAIEAGKLVLHEESINAVAVAKDTVQTMGQLTIDNPVTLSFNIDDALPPLYVDERRFKQIVLNLTSNAIKFTPPGGAVTLTMRLNDTGQHVLSVADTGIGMNAYELEQALSPFGQVDSQLARKHEGTGLGLPLTKGLVDLHGGDFHVASAKDAGTTITITFPAERTITSQTYSI